MKDSEKHEIDTHGVNYWSDIVFVTDCGCHLQDGAWVIAKCLHNRCWYQSLLWDSEAHKHYVMLSEVECSEVW
jgi:hypothetical protein